MTDVKHKPFVAIVAGGDSSEHDVSMRSAAGIMSFMDKAQFNCCVVEVKSTGWSAHYQDGQYPINRHDFTFDTPSAHYAFDFAYITIHGTPGEDGILQGYFDLIGMPYSTSSLLVEALTFNKFALNGFLRGYPNLHVSDSILLRKGDTMPSAESIIARIGLPCFVKPNAGGSSFGITKVKTAADLLPAISKAMHESSEVMVEKLMVGTEITCGCYRAAGEVVVFPITEVVTHREFFDYKAKYEGEVSEITPARIHPDTALRVQEMTRSIYRYLNCFGIIRIDYILSGPSGQEDINLLEINTTPGMTPTSFIPQQIAAAQLDMSQVLAEIINAKLQK